MDTPPQVNATLLVVDDDLDVAEMLNAYFSVLGYNVITVNYGEDALTVCASHVPDLVILDIHLPDIDGFAVAKRLRSTRNSQDVPIIFLTNKKDRVDVLSGLSLGANDYVTKPFDIQELRLRVRNALARTHQPVQRNPVTNLPDEKLLDARLREMLHEEDWAVMLVAVSNLDAFRDEYGFIAADDVLRAISMMIHNTLRDAGGAGDFIGHMAADRFLLVTTPAVAAKLAAQLRTRLDQAMDYFYPMRERETDTGRLKRIALNRLNVSIHSVEKGDGQFESINDLKVQLLQ